MAEPADFLVLNLVELTRFVRVTGNNCFLTKSLRMYLIFFQDLCVRLCVDIRAGVGGCSKLECCEQSVRSCMLSTAALKWSMLVLVSLGFACIIIGVILGVLQITASAEHSANSLVHSIMLIGSYSPAFCSKQECIS